MRTAEERLEFKNHFFKLGQGRIIDLTDKAYWSVFWEKPNGANDIFELLTPFDIQSLRDQNRSNFLSLIYVLCQKLIAFVDLKKPLPSSQVLNCVRFLTKLIPFLYELEEYKTLESKFFLSSCYEPLIFVDSTSHPPQKIDTSNILADKLLKSLIRLLFFKGFTITPSRANKDVEPTEMISYSLWEPGIGVNAKYQAPDLIVESNRSSVMKLILTLCGNAIYSFPSQVVANGSLFLTLLVSSLPRIEVLTLVCSLINVVCRSVRPSSNENMLQLNEANVRFTRFSYVTHCIQFLTLMIVYPLPPKQDLEPLSQLNILAHKPYNMARLYFGKLHKDQELLFLTSSLVNSLKSPIIGSGESESVFNLNLSRFGNSPPLWVMETMMLLWELFQCNASFKELSGPKFYSVICFMLVFYIKQYANNNRDQNIVRLASCFLLYLSHQKPFVEDLLIPSPEFMNSLPPSNSFNQSQLSTRDFLVVQLCAILSNYALSKQSHPSNSLLATTLIEILYNLVPLISSEPYPGTNDPTKKLNNINPRNGLSYSACTALTNLIVRFSNRDFLLRASFNPDLLALLIRSICIGALRDTQASRMLLFSILKGEKTYAQAWSTIYSFKNEYFNEDALMLKTVQDDNEAQSEINEKDDHESINSLATTPSNRSFTNLNIQEDDDPKSPPMMSQPQFSFYGNETMSASIEAKAIDRALRPSLPTGMTTKARGKQRKEASISKTWAGNDALRIIITVIIPHLKLTLSEVWAVDNAPGIDAFTLVQHIADADFAKVIEENSKQINYDFLPTSPLIPLKFSWSTISLGWYLSLLFSDIYNGIDSVEHATGGNYKIVKNLASTVLSFGKFFQGGDTTMNAIVETPETVAEVEKSITKVNHWSQTNIRLFKIKTEASLFDIFNSKLGVIPNQSMPGTPSLDRPSNLSRRLSDLRLQQIRSATPVSGMNTPTQEPEAYFPTRGNSVSSFHSLNTLNRSRTNTPRNSISN
ncbi:hypothetical protein CANTEDRAFT_118420 [Yamadazyma tenuis ATCC 10573]|uniref:Protein HID1 n=1 Tax=Candida tenuis (strain ATCC 10573 / BCRC 21748 / CBS 615 / JCM 9827 / NBRC 10315 / NRRL Y-1498 / VKM Y-70) TaxID=590646 RepID=G3AY51_CANTC|nr:uncharacterized protein CANTEDRAFT_118420 [Yamadazyma tenuis ATCC 10573]EGV65771.1 hypothetical protein CANTEDRAFT_118420 [Yamadazyma tenuis ATCC 10573]